MLTLFYLLLSTCEIYNTSYKHETMLALLMLNDMTVSFDKNS